MNKPDSPMGDVSSERCALGCILLLNASDEAQEKAKGMLSRLTGDDFQHIHCETIFRALKGLESDGKLITFNFLCQTLREKGLMQGDEEQEFIDGITQEISGNDEFPHYLKAVKAWTVRRAARQVINDPALSLDFLAESVRRLNDISSGRAIPTGRELSSLVRHNGSDPGELL